MGRDGFLIAGIGLVVVVAVVVLALGGFGTLSSTTSVGVVGEAREPPEDGSFGVVLSLHLEPGQRILGIPVRSEKPRVHVGMVVLPECLREDSVGTVYLRDDGPCAGLSASGELRGSGTTSSGGTLAIVLVQASRTCYDALTVGSVWPPQFSECTQ